MKAAVMSIEKKKERVDEALELTEKLDIVTQKAIYIATKMFLAAKEAGKEEQGYISRVKEERAGGM